MHKFGFASGLTLAPEHQCRRALMESSYRHIFHASRAEFLGKQGLIFSLQYNEFYGTFPASVVSDTINTVSDVASYQLVISCNVGASVSSTETAHHKQSIM